MSELTLYSCDTASKALTFEEYEKHPATAILYDDPLTSSTIHGVAANAYLLSGLYEEYAETLEFDAPPPQYGRIGMVALRSDSQLLDIYRRDAVQLERHRKEFGDLLCYTKLLLEHMGIRLGEAANIRGVDEFDTFAMFDAYAATWFATPTPLEPYRLNFRYFARSAARQLQEPSVPHRADAAVGAHMLLGSLSWIVQHRLDTTLAAVAAGNIHKLAIRHRNGTTFGSGDDR